jgi:hypothetical protein
MVGNINPTLLPFFEALNPGFKIYLGDFLVFDYFNTIQDIIDDVSIPLMYMYMVTAQKSKVKRFLY